jgi:multiple sugar transport system permease protein
MYGMTAWNLLMAASLVVALPCFILFFFAQRYFIQGIVVTGLKG